MEINRLAHQRSILAAMGVDLWVTRQAVHTQQIEYPIYRDQAPDQVIFAAPGLDTATSSLSPPVHANPSAAPQRSLTNSGIELNAQSSHHAQATQLLKQQAPQDIVDRDPQSQSLDQTAASADLDSEAAIERPPLHIDAFELQAYVFERCVLLLEGSALSAEQMRLWSNIHAVEAGQYFELKWPFPLAQYQDGRGAAMYIQGFINGLAQDKPIISLGPIPHLSDGRVQCLASLQQMLEQPMLKRDLWQAMQGISINKEV